MDVLKLVKIKRSPKPEKKWRAVFQSKAGKEKNVDFGSAGADDYTKTGDKEQRARYRARHRKDLQHGDYTKPGYLAWHILWGDSTDMETNVRAYKRRYNV